MNFFNDIQHFKIYYETCVGRSEKDHTSDLIEINSKSIYFF